MILFAEASRTFSLAGRRSVYGMRVDPDDRVVHLGWAPSPDGTDDPALEGTLPEYVLPRAGLDRQGRRDEVLTFGDTTYQEVALKLAFGDVRDVRLRYRSPEVRRPTACRRRSPHPARRSYSSWLTPCTRSRSRPVIA